MARESASIKTARETPANRAVWKLNSSFATVLITKMALTVVILTLLTITGVIADGNGQMSGKCDRRQPAQYSSRSFLSFFVGVCSYRN